MRTSRVDVAEFEPLFRTHGLWGKAFLSVACEQGSAGLEFGVVQHRNFSQRIIL